jgi:hypothetical protein
MRDGCIVMTIGNIFEGRHLRCCEVLGTSNLGARNFKIDLTTKARRRQENQDQPPHTFPFSSGFAGTGAFAPNSRKMCRRNCGPREYPNAAHEKGAQRPLSTCQLSSLFALGRPALANYTSFLLWRPPRRNWKPTKPTPTSIMAQVCASGTAVTVKP